MNRVDSSGWLEYFANGPNAKFFASTILDTEQLVVSTPSLLEVFQPVLPQRGRAMSLFEGLLGVRFEAKSRGRGG